MRTVFLDSITLGNDIDLSPVTDKFETIVYSQTLPCEVEERIKNAQVIVVNKVKLNESNLKNAKNLKLICLAATGYDNVDINYCKENNISVYNVVGYSTDSVAQVTVSMVLSLVNKLEKYNKFVKDGSYTKTGKANFLDYVYYELAGKTWGIAGLGGIGRKVADIAKAFGCKVIAFKRTEDEEFETVSLDRLCRESDIITIHLPHTNQTDKIFSSEQIAKMKENVVIVNTSRGKVIEEEGILNALENKKIAGFGTDVYPMEPFEKGSVYDKLRGMENVCMTPHMAWGAVESRKRCIEIISENITDFIEGKESKNKVV